jgi:hypothetical protein
VNTLRGSAQTAVALLTAYDSQMEAETVEILNGLTQQDTLDVLACMTGIAGMLTNILAESNDFPKADLIAHIGYGVTTLPIPGEAS